MKEAFKLRLTDFWAGVVLLFRKLNGDFPGNASPDIDLETTENELLLTTRADCDCELNCCRLDHVKSTTVLFTKQM